MISIRKYHLLRDEKDRYIYHVKSQEASICPICGVSDLIVIGSRKRILYDGSGEKRILVIRRLRCKGCSRVHHELPDQIVPYKRYASKSIEEILDQDSPAVACESSSIYRIRRWFLEISEYIRGVFLQWRHSGGWFGQKKAGAPSCGSKRKWEKKRDGWQELSESLQTQIYGYIPVLHFCPDEPAINSC